MPAVNPSGACRFYERRFLFSAGNQGDCVWHLFPSPAAVCAHFMSLKVSEGTEQKWDMLRKEGLEHFNTTAVLQGSVGESLP